MPTFLLFVSAGVLFDGAFFPVSILKGGLSGRMTYKQFLNVLELFYPLKRKLSKFRFRTIIIFNKKEPQSCQFATYRKNALFEFLTSQTGPMAFPIFKVITR